MIMLELALKKMKKKANRFIYTSFLLVLAFICIISLYTAYQNPNELTVKSFNNAISNYGKMPEGGTNDLINICLYYITKVYNFIVIVPLTAIPAEIYREFLDK